jgi:hypothetical protein
MNEKQVPLTPAAQMQRIREAVLAAETPQEARATLAAYASQLKGLRQRIAELESKMLLKEQPFTSRTPVVGPMIARLRTVWNWMSTKWYVLPLIDQQNEFNATVTRTLHELTVAVESLTNLVYEMQMRVAELEASSSPQTGECQE